MLRVAAWQMCSRGSVEQCKLSVLRGVAAASRARADVVTFPENSLGLGCSDARPWNVEKGELAWLGEAALEHNIDICLGVIEDTARSRPSNSLVWFGADGAVKSVYRKIHLFDHAESGLQESAKIEPGNTLVTVSCRGVECGLSICYDLRFPAMFLSLARAGAKIIFAPSAFTVATGEAHFRKLVTARALDSQCYVVAAAQCGQHSETRRTWGESLIVDPWGSVVAAADPRDQEEQLLVHDCSSNFVEETRSRMPLQHHVVPSIDKL